MEYVQTETALRRLVEELGTPTLVAADTEAAGYHRYHDRVCLLQLSTRERTWIVDTLALDQLNGLADVFRSRATEVVFHDADYDLRLLHRDFGITVGALFDTKIAAQFVGETSYGLASLVEKYLDVRLAKKFQRADWAQRPLPREMLEYAAEDTRYLPALRDRLRERLESLGRLGWAEEEFAIEEDVRWRETSDEDAWLRLKGTRDLRPRQLAALRELYRWRERVAEARDVATFRVLSNEAMIELSRRMPASLAGIMEVPGTPRALADRHGAELLAALRRARELPQSELPERRRGPGRPPPDPEFDALMERLREARDEAASELELERGFLMPRSQLEEVARARPTTLEALAALPGIRRWQVEAMGERLVEAVRR